MAYDKYFLSEGKPEINPEKMEAIVRHALIEDIGRGDITTQLTIPKDKMVKAKIIAREDFLLCGIIVAKMVFKAVDSSVEFIQKIKEGKRVKAGKTIATISGKASSILTAERVALNLLSMLSGIATKTGEFVKEIEPYKTKITDTRKTMPGLRELQKYAVRIGGGHNHRIRLDEMILIKDNHIKVTDGYSKLPSVPKGYKIEIEVQNLEEFKHALYFKPDIIMLDNMKVEDIKEAVKIRNSTEFKSHHLPSKLEASGGIYLKNIREYAATGVEIISIGELTDSVKSVDISLEVT
ncbi:MAG: carboxylating nicotinate-nucleotide diphosphorylase [Candidatus Omnitrophica bacterium]|jgi:nicotinate-nucleotide pyrophosphorylase (carboxylating)|nr:carboxylating nicotinate-nucleotide diphosphorylase [Candidatus Omnitrophota bacterium]MDD5690614.1 carboxylating nicotinate-nucleotide diphosphorylase [Candidatus Omnitrophota bacterium]